MKNTETVRANDRAPQVKITWVQTRTQHLVRCEPYGTYYARFKEYGNTRRIALKTKSEAAAKLKLADIQRKRQGTKGVKPGAKCPGIKDLWSDYELGWKPDLTEGTKEYYREIRDSFQRGKKSEFTGKGLKVGTKDAMPEKWPEFFTKAINKLTETDCQIWYKRYCEQFSPSRSNSALGIVNSIFEIAIKQRWRIDNPAADLKRRAQYKTEEDHRLDPDEIPTEDQLAKIVEYLELVNTDSANTCKLLLNTGCRVESTWHLRWKHVDEKRNLVYIAKAKNGPYSIPLHPPLKAFLDNLKQGTNPDRESMISKVRSIKNSLRTAAKKADFKGNCTHHTMRHVFATRALEDGVDFQTLASWLGHKDGGELVRMVYGHLRKDHVDAQSQKLKVRNV